MKKKLILALATVGFIGWAPYRLVPFRKMKGAGLLGTLVGWAGVWGAPTGPWFFILTLGVIALAVWVSDLAERQLTHDDPRIVIDEVAGIFVACAGISREWRSMLIALVCFRVLDVVKGPWGRAAARLPGGWGIVADDLVAALLANGLTRLVLQW